MRKKIEIWGASKKIVLSKNKIAENRGREGNIPSQLIFIVVSPVLPILAPWSLETAAA
jgi:hypothetical protein